MKLKKRKRIDNITSRYCHFVLFQRLLSFYYANTGYSHMHTDYVPLTFFYFRGAWVMDMRQTFVEGNCVWHYAVLLISTFMDPKNSKTSMKYVHYAYISTYRNTFAENTRSLRKKIVESVYLKKYYLYKHDPFQFCKHISWILCVLLYTDTDCHLD